MDDGGMLVSYDTLGDVLAIRFRHVGPGEGGPSKVIDDARLLKYHKDGSISGVEFLGASLGIDLDGIPHADEIRKALQSLRGVLGVPSAAA